MLGQSGAPPQAGESKTRIIRTLSWNRRELHRLWQKSPDAEWAEKNKLKLGKSAWYTHLKLHHYEFKQPKKRVDLCDLCLEYKRKATSMVASQATKSRHLVPDRNCPHAHQEPTGAPINRKPIGVPLAMRSLLQGIITRGWRRTPGSKRSARLEKQEPKT